MAENPEAAATLTHVSTRGIMPECGENREAFTAVIIPDRTDDSDTTDRLAHCEIETSSANMARVKLGLHSLNLKFSVSLLENGRLRCSFKSKLSTQKLLSWLKRVFPGATLTDIRYWVTQGGGETSPPAFYIDDLEGTGQRLRIRQHVTESGSAEAVRLSEDSWRRFAVRVIDSGLIRHLEFQPLPDGDHQLLIHPTSDVSHVLDELVVSLASLFPQSQPRIRRRRSES